MVLGLEIIVFHPATSHGVSRIGLHAFSFSCENTVSVETDMHKLIDLWLKYLMHDNKVMENIVLFKKLDISLLGSLRGKFLELQNSIQ